MLLRGWGLGVHRPRPAVEPSSLVVSLILTSGAEAQRYWLSQGPT